MQAIITKFLPATDTRPSRVKATAQVGTLTLAWDHALDVTENHDAVAKALADTYGWLDFGAKLVGGGLPDGTGNAYVLIPLCDQKPLPVQTSDQLRCG